MKKTYQQPTVTVAEIQMDTTILLGSDGEGKVQTPDSDTPSSVTPTKGDGNNNVYWGGAKEHGIWDSDDED